MTLNLMSLCNNNNIKLVKLCHCLKLFKVTSHLSKKIDLKYVHLDLFIKVANINILFVVV